jgi:imidazolonepropionase-like amidohydrolase
MIMKSIYSYTIIFLLVLNIAFAQAPRPADSQEQPIAIENATIHIGNGQVVENGYIAFMAGKITSVGEGSAPQVDGQKVIDAMGKDIYPGLIMPATNLGLEEVSAVRATRDYQEVGSITPNVRSQVAFNTDSEILPTYRFNGILTAQVAPQGGFVTGSSSIMMLDAWNWEDATFEKDDAIHVNWPAKTFGARWWMGETARRPNENYDEQVKMITDLFKDAKAYASGDNSPVNLKLEAMKGVINGQKRVFVYADQASVIVEAINSLLDMKVANIVLVGGEDAYYVRELLVDNNIPVILDNIHRRPSREEEAVDWPYRLPGLLTEAGVQVSLRHSGMLARGRNLPFYAGTSAAYGMNKEDALKMITSNTAKALGVGDRLGTLEEGKDATLLLVEGDLLDMRSSIIIKAFIQGRDVITEGKQQVLYERFKEKYGE